jgi:hypothetical protein
MKNLFFNNEICEEVGGVNQASVSLRSHAAAGQQASGRGTALPRKSKSHTADSCYALHEPHGHTVKHIKRLVLQILPKFYYAKKRFPVTSKCRQIHEVLNVDEIKN